MTRRDNTDLLRLCLADSPHSETLLDTIKEAWWHDAALTEKGLRIKTDRPEAVVYGAMLHHYHEYSSPPTLKGLRAILGQKADDKGVSRLLEQLDETPLSVDDASRLVSGLRACYAKVSSTKLMYECANLMDADPARTVDSLDELANNLLRVTGECRERADWSGIVWLNELPEYAQVAENTANLVPYPWASWNSYLTGLKRGEVTFISGKGATGKSFVVKAIAYHAAELGYKVACADLEMSVEQTSNRYLAWKTGIPADKMYKGALTAAEEKVINKVKRRHAKMSSNGGLVILSPEHCNTVERLRSSIKRLYKGENPDLIVVDYPALMQPSSNRQYSASDSIGEIVRELKLLAMELRCAILAVAHLKSGSNDDVQFKVIYDRADQVILLRRSSSRPYVEPDAFSGNWVGTPGVLEARVQRNRSGRDMQGKGSKALLLEVEYATASVKDFTGDYYGTKGEREEEENEELPERVSRKGKRKGS